MQVASYRFHCAGIYKHHEVSTDALYEKSKVLSLIATYFLNRKSCVNRNSILSSQIICILGSSISPLALIVRGSGYTDNQTLLQAKMPRTKSSIPVLITGWLKNLPAAKYFQQAEETLYCEACCKSYQFKKLSDLNQHLKSSAHLRAAARLDKQPEWQPRAAELPSEQEYDFQNDLCEALVASNIPWVKVENRNFKGFLEKYTGRNVPTESTLRNFCLKPLYLKALDSIRTDIGQSRIWVSVVETIDALGRVIAAVNIGALEPTGPGKPHLLMIREFEITNSAKITQLVLDSFGLLWPGMQQSYIDSHFILFLSHGVEHMLKTGTNLKGTYPKLLHVTCLAHSINLVAEEVRRYYQHANHVIAALLAVFKEPSYIQTLKSTCPDLPILLASECGTWLQAVEYCYQNLEKIKLAVNKLDKTARKCIDEAKSLVNNSGTVQELRHILTNFGFLITTMKQLQSPDMTIMEAITIVETVKNKLLANTGNESHAALKVQHQFNSVLLKSPDLKTIRAVIESLTGHTKKGEFDDSILTGFTSDRLSSLFYSPGTTVNSKELLSKLDSVRENDQHQLRTEDFEMQAVCVFQLADSSDYENGAKVAQNLVKTEIIY